MKQYVRIFSSFHKCIDDSINDYLKEHPNYSIDKIAFAGQATDKDDRVLVVFNIGEMPTYSVARGVNSSQVPEFENASSTTEHQR